MIVLSVKNVSKEYKEFKLNNVSFNVEEGHIVGFIGRNGAGKTTTIKSILNIVKNTSGEVYYFSKNLLDNENEIKNQIGYFNGTINYYPRKKLIDIVNITKVFYSSWDENEFNEYTKLFKLDLNKCPCELSDGMKVKFNLLLALSHHAKILILDEPTSGLDPFSRDEILELFIELKKRGTAILFSTHITSDLEKCADDIIYIKNGSIVSSSSKKEFINKYKKDNETLEETILRLERECNE